MLNQENEIVISKASEWFGANRMRLNKDKTVSLLFTLNESQELATKSRTDTKFLGIYIDSRLSWSTQIEYLKAKLAKANYLIRNLRDCIPSPYVRGLYFSFYESIIRYGLVLWGGSSRVKENFILQKQVIRIISRSHFTASCRALFVDLRILTIYNLYILDLLILVHNTSESDFDIFLF
ncbi:hypothetical protein C0J52_15791 [Blattella germanica]|nr:hypothetical protein C0J52_15791 [Blattella germanica]